MPHADLKPVNMHMHTHYSFNAQGMSPAALVEESVKQGLYAAAICDFDVLDGLEEFYKACDVALLRGAVGMETRVFFPEYADQVINSPGEPGVYYFMGMGFGRMPSGGSPAGRTLEELRERAGDRNRALVARINKNFSEIAVDYEEDVLPLTPSGNATERHVVQAYIAKVRLAESEERQVETWRVVLEMPEENVRKLMQDEVGLQNTARSKLMKRGGAGYVQPDSTTFPPLEDAIAMILDAGAIPMATWLDGTSEGESDPAKQLELLRSKGVAAVNIVPDRNWNIRDPEVKKLKVEKLHEFAETARRMQFPVNVGTELNSFGLPFVDDFCSDALEPLWPLFFQGANIMVGQARLSRYARFSYCGPKAEAEFGKNLADRNDFFEKAGKLPCPEPMVRDWLSQLDAERAYLVIRDSVLAGKWHL